MKKTIPIIVLALLCLNFTAKAQQPTNPTSQKNSFTGKVISASNGEALPGAVVKVTTTNQTFITNDRGEFSFSLAEGSYDFGVYYLSYKAKVQSIQIPLKEPLIIALDTDAQSLKEVEIVSNGYQKIPRERATGSFVLLDSALLNRKVGTNIIDRLEGVTNSLFIDRRSGSNKLNVRGMNSLSEASMGALVVVDNFPYVGNIGDINPEDVETITVLKDAAATSIWGARAGNGVIVITLKKGKFGQAFKVNAHISSNFVEAPNLWYRQNISSSDFIDVEQMLYGKGFYNNDLLATNNQRPPISPVVDILDKQNKGLIGQDEAAERINALRNLDYRDDLSDYFYRTAINRQHSLSVSGGGNTVSYLLSAGFDRNLGSNIGNEVSRYTLRSVNTFKPLKKLEILTSFAYSASISKYNGTAANFPISGGRGHLYPYARLVDKDGNALQILNNYNTNFIDTAGNGKLLDWAYRPYDELRYADYETNSQDLNLGVNLKYELPWGLGAEILYKYEKITSGTHKYNSMDTYFTRDLINRFTRFSGNAIIRAIPLGGVLDQTNGKADNQNIRGQLNFNRTIEKHVINGLVGSEFTATNSEAASFRTYGYNDETISYASVDFVNAYPIYGGLSSNAYIPNSASFKDNKRRVVSLYSNAAYTYDSKYTISASARRDGSNLFGVNVNQKWKPLWSVGASWTLSNEKFYNLTSIPYLRFRATHGFSGTMAGGASDRPVLLYIASADRYTNLKQAQITYPPNPNLKWEQVRMNNYGVDLALKNDRISASLEYYTKLCTDLFSFSPIDATTGFSAATANVAEIKSKGFDVLIKSKNLTGTLKWNTSFSVSYVRDIVSKFYGNITTASVYVGSALSMSPIVGHPLYAMASYKFAGLDPQTGDPLGYFNGETSKAYGNIAADSIKNLSYNGSAVPFHTGFLLNNFAWKRFSLSVNITYKLNYYFRRNTISYSSLYGNWIGHADFNKRWQKPGDELITNIPSMTYPANSARDAFFSGSEATIEKGDHIRFQDIRLSYDLTNSNKKIPLKSLQVYCYVNNPGFLWQASKAGIDPDFVGTSFPAQRSIAFGFRTNF